METRRSQRWLSADSAAAPLDYGVPLALALVLSVSTLRYVSTALNSSYQATVEQASAVPQASGGGTTAATTTHRVSLEDRAPLR